MQRIHFKSIDQKEQGIPEEYRNVAKGMEAQFIQYMIEQMKRTIDRVSPDSAALKFYRSILNSHHANIMAEKNNGLGLQKIILDQIYPLGKKNISPNDVISSYHDVTEGSDSEKY